MHDLRREPCCADAPRRFSVAFLVISTSAIHCATLRLATYLYARQMVDVILFALLFLELPLHDVA
jgi:hypothetical protein